MRNLPLQSASRMKDLIEQYKAIVIPIATPYCTGTGFLLAGQGLIVTNEQIVRDNREVAIEGEFFARQVVRVLYTDTKYDLAFLEAPKTDALPAVEIEKEDLAPGDLVVAMGHAFGMKFAAAQGAVTGAAPNEEDLLYLQHDAILSTGNSGGPLFNKAGRIAGVNTFLSRDGVNVAYALPAKYLIDTLAGVQQSNGKMGARCESCHNIVFEHTIDQQRYCPFCGTRVLLPNQVDEYEPIGVAYTIEAMLAEAGHDVRLSRRGPSNWGIRQGSAHINISYYEKTGLITGDAYLCQLPKDHIKPLYEFLLRQNYDIENLNFSVKGNDIILSLLIYDRYLNVDSGLMLIKHLFETADHYDNLLVERFGALWREEEDFGDSSGMKNA